MTKSMYPKYAVVDCTVIRHKGFGLIVRLDSGESGFVDSSCMADTVIHPNEWPAVNSRIRGVVLGYTLDGRVRLSARKRDISLVESLMDPENAFREWEIVGGSRVLDVEVRQRFYRSPNARALLRWALAHGPSSEVHQRALVLISEAPSNIRNDIAPGGSGE